MQLRTHVELTDCIWVLGCQSSNKEGVLHIEMRCGRYVICLFEIIKNELVVKNNAEARYPAFLFVVTTELNFRQSDFGCLADVLVHYRMKERNISIDILKCLAALLITNSHMGLLYGKYSFLATGGCIGDVLFFFCSGFTLFLKPMNGLHEFPDWYKKRISRIYPSIIAVAFLACIFFDTHWDIVQIALSSRYWFVQCIMIYYIAIYFVGCYFKDKFFTISVIVALGTAVWFYFLYNKADFSIYSPKYYIRWLLFFDFMLLGAKMGTMTDCIKSRPLVDIFLLILCIVAFYALFIIGTRFKSLCVAQYFSFIPLMGIMFYIYKVGASKWAEKLYRHKVGNFIIRFIGGLCLEIYLVQFFLFTDRMNNLFPFNILIMFLVIFVVAYLTRCLARLISQTFKENPYDWRKIVNPY